ncbi:putative HTH-type transcriptional regulator YtcD [Corynebacterium atrinae]|uniref:winged helix-turn-helix transcriptional regulator n=1 Tax=Corynebacterium atrinae TaxID=1336740 RepID=UPI0025B37C24|nr:helix-turn-helix domain-containing protein [Corynebacterium atrinae]WJY62980.1 putative HTH-type transcriptional regulator YtcD [Corynebacterium atrinae]
MTTEDWNPYERDCPTRRLLDQIGDTWTVLVVGALSDGPLRFGELTRRIEGISQKMLTQTLRALERDGLVKRTQYPEIPPRVEYELTPEGHSLREPLKILEDWANAHMSSIITSRKLYDAPA